MFAARAEPAERSSQTAGADLGVMREGCKVPPFNEGISSELRRTDSGLRFGNAAANEELGFGFTLLQVSLPSAPLPHAVLLVGLLSPLLGRCC